MTSTVFDSLSPSSADSPSPLSRRGVIDEEEQLLAQLQRLQEQYAALRGGGVGSHFSLGAGGEEPSIPPKRVIVVSYDLPVSLPSSRKILGQETTSYEASPRPKQLSVQEQQLFAETNWIPDEKKSRTANAKPQPVLREEYSALCKHLEKSNLFDFVWIGGLNVQNLEVSHLQSVQKELMDLYNCIPVFAYGETFDRHYNGFCKSVLWPILHSIPPSKIYYNGDGSRNSHVESESVDIFWKSFLEVNEAFAQQIIQVYNPETDVIWVQDYHLCILPFILRQRVPDATIGFFLHTPVCLTSPISLKRHSINHFISFFYSFLLLKYFEFFLTESKFFKESCQATS